MKTYLLALIIFIATASIAAYGETITVPGDYPTIQAAINASVSGDTVRVSDGEYSGTDNNDIEFDGKEITLTSVNGPLNCIIRCQENSRGFFIRGPISENLKILGFTIRNGKYDCGG